MSTAPADRTTHPSTTGNQRDAAKPDDAAGAARQPQLRDESARQPELPGTRTAAGSPPFMRRCLTAALHLLGLTHRDCYAYAVLVSHCRAYVDGEHGTCRLLYRTWAAEAGVWRPKPGEPAEAAERRLTAATRHMREIASRLKGAGLLMVKRRIRAAELLVFPPPPARGVQIGPNQTYLDRSKSDLSIERGSGKGAPAHQSGAGASLSSPIAAAGTSRATSADRRQQQQQQDRDQVRIEGLFGAIAARCRELGHDYDEQDERRRLREGEIDVDRLQRHADELATEVRKKRLRRAHGPR